METRRTLVRCHLRDGSPSRAARGHGSGGGGRATSRGAAARHSRTRCRCQPASLPQRSSPPRPALPWMLARHWPQRRNHLPRLQKTHLQKVRSSQVYGLLSLHFTFEQVKRIAHQFWARLAAGLSVDASLLLFGLKCAWPPCRGVGLQTLRSHGRSLSAMHAWHQRSDEEDWGKKKSWTPWAKRGDSSESEDEDA